MSDLRQQMDAANAKANANLVPRPSTEGEPLPRNIIASEKESAQPAQANPAAAKADEPTNQAANQAANQAKGELTKDPKAIIPPTAEQLSAELQKKEQGAKEAPKPAPVKEVKKEAPKPAPVKEVKKEAPKPAPVKEVKKEAPKPQAPIENNLVVDQKAYESAWDEAYFAGQTTRNPATNMNNNAGFASGREVDDGYVPITNEDKAYVKQRADSCWHNIFDTFVNKSIASRKLELVVRVTYLEDGRAEKLKIMENKIPQYIGMDAYRKVTDAVRRIFSSSSECHNIGLGKSKYKNWQEIYYVFELYVA